jgi:hypothetical protein
MKPAVQKQGMCVVERDGDGFLVMFPDGNLQGAMTKAQAEKACSQWFKQHVDADSIGVGTIEWRL